MFKEKQGEPILSNLVYHASAAGSLMLMGEHAVLRNKPALVMALNKRIKVSLRPRQDNKVLIKSTLGELTLTLDTIKLLSPFQFVLAAINHYKQDFKTGFTLNIESEFSDKIGFGSSAAVLVATLAALGKMLQLDESPETLFLVAKKIMLEVQSLGSGADIAASIYGGVVLYRQSPFVMEKISVLPPIVAIYSGSKMPTVEVIKKVEGARLKNIAVFNEIDTSIAMAVESGYRALQQENWELLGTYMNTQNKLMEKLGVSNQILRTLLHLLQNQSTIYGAKISGAGLGDCVIGLGHFKDLHHYVKAPQEAISVQGSLQGLIYE